MTPRPSLWQAIAQARRDDCPDLSPATLAADWKQMKAEYDRSELDVAKLAHGDICECQRCRINQLEADLSQYPQYDILPEDRTP